MPWFHRRRAVAEQEQQRIWRQARMKTDIQEFISKMSEVEVVDSFNAIEKHLQAETQVLLTYWKSHIDYFSLICCKHEAFWNIITQFLFSKRCYCCL